MIKDLTNLKFTKLTVIKFSHTDKNNVSHWECICDCGNPFVANSNRLKVGHTKSCGCLLKESTEKYKHDDLIGKKFGRLTVLNKDCVSGMRTHWKCQCDCGNIIISIGSNLKRGNTKSCGCYRLKEGNNSIINCIFHDYSNRSRKKNIEFLLTIDDFEILIKNNCFYCGTKESNTKRYHGLILKYNGLDRLNSDLGYTKDNVVPCCKTCNIAKNTMTIIEFKDWITRIYNHYINT